MAWRLPALKAEAKTVKAMKTPAAKAKGMKPDTNTMKATKTPAAKAKGAERLPGHNTKRRNPWRWSSNKSPTAACKFASALQGWGAGRGTAAGR